MKAKTLFFFLFFIYCCLVTFFIAPSLFQSHITNSDFKTLDTDSVWGTYANYTLAGDFSAYYNSSGSFHDFQDTSGTLYLNKYGTIGWAFARRDFTNTTTNYLRNGTIEFSWLLETGGSSGSIYIRYYFTDNTYKTVFSNTQTGYYHIEYGSPGWYPPLEIVITDNKTIDFIEIGLYTSTPSMTNKIWVTDELYEGYIPVPLNIAMYPSTPRILESINYYCEVYTNTLPLEIEVTLSLRYVESGNIKGILMAKEWQTDNSYTSNTTLSKIGDYLFSISVYLLGWKDSLYFSTLYAFKVYSYDALLYPAEAKLTLWSPLGLAIPTNLKVYLGQSETYELYMPQIDKNLNWQAYSANTSEKYVAYIEEDNKLFLNCYKNGVKANVPPQSGLYPDIEHYESFVFDIRVRVFSSTDQTVLIGLNFFQADYALNISTAYIDQWVQYIIPISFFNWHVNVTDALAQICFYGSFRAEIKNIFVADYKNITALLTNANNITNQYEVSTQGYLSQIKAFENTSHSALANWNNYTTWDNHTYSNLYCQNNSGYQSQSHAETRAASPTCWNNASSYQLETNFNVTEFTSQNATIVNNQTVRLALTSNVKYYYPFAGDASDVIDSNPGTVQSATLTTDRNSNANAAYNFLAVGSQYISLATLPLTEQQEFTIAAWVVTSTTGTRKQILSIGNEALSQAIWFFINTGNYLAADCSGYAGPTSAATITDGNWHFVALVKTGSGDSTVLQLYIDGAASGTPKAMYTGLNIVDEFKNIGCGSAGYGHDWFFDGKIDDVMIFNEAKSASGISFIYNAGVYAHNAYYASPSYDLGVANVFYYNILKFNRALGTSGTTLTTQYRVSVDNVTWQAWSAGYNSNQTINTAQSQYYQFRINLTSTGCYTPKSEWVNLTYTQANGLLYTINETNYFNFTYIYNPNIINITLDATIEASRFLACNSYVITSAGGSHSEENDYTYTWGNDTAYWRRGGFINEPNPAYAYVYLEINASKFSTATVSRFYTKWKAMWNAVSQGTCGIYCFYNSTWITLDTASADIIRYVDVNISNAQHFINSTGFLKIRFYSGSGTNSGWRVYNVFIYYFEVFDSFTPIATLQLWNFASSTYTTLNLNANLTDYALTTDYFNTTHVKIAFNITKPQYFACTHNLTIKICYFYYANASFYYYYTLNAATLYYFYYINVSSTLKGNTSINFQYRTSNDNVTFGAWSSSLTINAFKNKYLHYRIDCNTLNSWNYSIFNAANLLFQYRNITYYYVLDLLQTAFTAPAFLKNVTLKFQVASQISNLLNASVNIYKFSTSTWQNLSSINQFYEFDVTNNYFNSSKHVKLQIKVYASQSFTLTYKQTELWVYGFKFNRTCYISANFSFSNDFNLNVFYYHFNAPRSKVYLSFWNGTHWITHSSYAAATNFTTVTFPIANVAQLSKLRIKFVYYDAYLSDTVIVANISRYYFVAEYLYRLISEENRHATDFLTFDTEAEWLCLTDYYGSIIHKQLINRTSNGYYIDVMLNFFEVYFCNYVPNSTITYMVYNRGLQINVTVPYGVIIPISLFTDDYIVTQYLEENKTIINTWDCPISRIKNRVFSYNYAVPVKEYKPSVNYWTEYWYLWVLIAFLVLVIVIRKYSLGILNFLKQKEKSQPKLKKEKVVTKPKKKLEEEQNY